MDDIIEEIKDLPKWLKIVLGAILGVFGFIALIVGVAVVGSIIMGAGGETAVHPPTAQFTSDYNAEANELTVTHNGGDPISSGNLVLEVNGDEREWPASDDFKVSETVTVSEIASGDTVDLIWRNPSDDERLTIASFTA